MQRHSADALIEQLLSIYVKGQQAGQFAASNPQERLSWYIMTLNSLIVTARGDEEFGLPPAELLMRVLTAD